MQVTIHLLTIGVPEEGHVLVADELQRRGLPYRVRLEPACAEPEVIVYHLGVTEPVFHEKGTDNILGYMDKIEALANATIVI